MVVKSASRLLTSGQYMWTKCMKPHALVVVPRDTYLSDGCHLRRDVYNVQPGPPE